MEIAAYRILRNTANCGAVAQTLPLQQGLSGYYVNIQCTSTSETEGPATVQLFSITATGCNNATCPLVGHPGAGDTTYVERQLHLTLAR